MAMSKPVHAVYIHHAVVPASMRPSPTKVREWGYTVAFTKDGGEVEGHGFGEVGWHTHKLNSLVYGAAFVGDFHPRVVKGKQLGLDVPTPAALNAFRSWLARGIREEWIAPDAVLIGHRDSPHSNTACPGDTLYAFIPYLQSKESALVPEAPNHPANAPAISVAGVVVPTKMHATYNNEGTLIGFEIESEQGYHILHADGGIFSLGAAEYVGRTHLREE